MMRDDDFDLEKLKLSDDMLPKNTGVLGDGKLRKRHYRAQFVKVPVEWMRRLESARLTATWKVALHLLYQSFKDRRQTIRLANGVMALKGITPGQKWRAIAELEKLGLVNVEHRPCKSPDITLLYPEDGG